MHEPRLPLGDKQMSRRHAEVWTSANIVWVRDLGSTNGTFVNGQPVSEEGRGLQPGDVLSLGDTVLLHHLATAVPPVDTPIDGLIGFSDPMKQLRANIRQYARAPAPVLILGETGVGKEAVAKALSDLGRARRGRPYIAFNTTATSPHLVDATLFGSERGAYTGADRAREGLFKAAHTGTLFLDEIGDLSPDVQVKLLRALQEGEVTPVGSVRPLKVDVRVVAATNRVLIERVKQGVFRADLYARLAKLTLKAPALRDHKEDVPLLAHHLGERFAGRPVRFDTEAIIRLMLHDWPLNVRELDGIVTQAVVDHGDRSGTIRLSPELIERMAEHTTLTEATPAAKAANVLTRDALHDAMTRHRGNMKQVATDLGKDRGYVYRVMKRFDLNPDDYRV